MQQFIGVGTWDDDAILQRHQQLVAETPGDAETGVLIIDGCDFPKQGTHAVGVARQWCGPLGKVANCQASVVACYASTRGHTLVDRRLSVHEDWFTEDYRTRRARCGMPADLTFQTRTEPAWAMVAGLRERGVLPFRWVTGDEGFGNTPALLDQLVGAGLAYCMAVPHNVRVWAHRPATAVPPATGKNGAPFTRLRLVPGAPPPVRVDALAAALPPSAWQVAQIQEGSTGPLVAEVACVRAVAVREGLPGPDVWLVLRRSRAGDRELKASLCGAAADTPLPTLVGLLGLRRPVEQARKEAKDELGLDHDEVRGWRGWHHHTTMTLLAQHVLVRLRSRLGGATPALTVPQVRQLLNVTLPAQQRDAAAMIAFIREVQRRNYAAACSACARTPPE